MTQTTNIGLKKIDGSENWRQIFDYHNDSADKTDSAVAAVQDGLAIVADGNTHAAVAKGQFVYVRNHDTLAEGLYKATEAIATNETLSTGNLTAESFGGLNDLQEQVTSLKSKIGNVGDKSLQAQITSLSTDMIKYMDITDTTPVNVNSKSGQVITRSNFIGCSTQTNGVLPLPYVNGGSQYIKLVNYNDLSAFSGSATIRVWYR